MFKRRQIVVVMLILAVIIGFNIPINAESPDSNKHTEEEKTYIVVYKSKDKKMDISTISPSGKLKYDYKVINAQAVTIPESAVDKIKARDEVAYVLPDVQLQADLNDVVNIMNVTSVWSLGYNGSGINVSVIDSGIDSTHPDLQGKLVLWHDFLNDSPTPYDDWGHGTHVAGIIAGSGAASSGKYVGLANGANLFCAKVLNTSGLANASDVLAAIDWSVQNHADVISMSLSFYPHWQPLDDAVHNAVQAGVVFVCSAGNWGPNPGTVKCPSDCIDAITVGSIDKQSIVSSWSSRGPTWDEKIKPDIVAVGGDVISDRASGTRLGSPLNTYYTYLSGTSMACPEVSAACAILLEANPGLSPLEVKNALRGSADRIAPTYPNNDTGWGRLNVRAALNDVLPGNAITADFEANETSGTAPFAVAFTDKSTGSGITSWQWNFGDGTVNSTVQDPIHYFTGPGTYTITLTVENDGGSSTKQAVDMITVTSLTPVADFTSNVTSGMSQLAVQFTDTSTNIPAAWQWNFGDGQANQTEQNPAHYFPANTGPSNVTYTVTLTSSNAGGSNTVVKTNYITVMPQKPLANFNANKTSGTIPFAVQFTNMSTGAGATYQWNFGDGTSNSTLENPIHYYESAGTYTVTLTVFNDGGYNTKQVTDMITANIQAPVANFTSNVTYGYSQLAVQFTDASTGAPTAWQWNFGDGTGNSTVQNPAHYFPANTGPSNVTYTVTLTSSNAGGSNTLVKASMITVMPQKPVVNFQANRTSGTVPLAVAFMNTSTGGAGATYQWSFGDGTSNSTLENPAHTYTQAGTYTVTLIVQNDGGSNTEQKVGYITVHNATPVANFSANKTSGIAPLAVQFTDLCIGANMSYEWSFGDSSGNSTQKNPLHVFTNYCTYTVTLTVRNDGGSDTKQVVGMITVKNTIPTASFTSNVTSGNAPLTVLFTNTSTGANITVLQWNYGDGSPNESSQSPTHTYTQAGTYTVMLTAANDGGNHIATALITVHNATPVVNFTSNVTTGNAPLAVQFYDNTTGMNTSYQWSFGDGSGNSTQKNPAHTYTQAGVYTVTLTAINDGGKNTKQVASMITVLPQKPVADFSANVTAGTSPLAVQFTDASTNSPTAWQWDFGDASGNSSVQNPAHYFPVNNGATNVTYTITMTATNAGGSGTVQKTAYITVIPQAPVANFAANITAGTPPLTIQFNDTSSGGPGSAWQWDFGDASGNSTVQNPTHAFPMNTGATNITYTITMTATNAGGSGTIQKVAYITVVPQKPVPDFSGNVTTGRSVLVVAFTGTSSAGIASSWQWNYGNGSQNDTTQNTVHAFPANTGATNVTYTITLTESNVAGSATTQKTAYITVLPAQMTANFSANQTSGTVPMAVQFNDITTGSTPSAWQWDFGDGTGNSTVQSPAHHYESAGTYAVTMTATNAGGSNTVQKTSYITVLPQKPVADFTANKTSGTSILAVQFTDASTNTPTGWQWNFGDGTGNSTVQNPVHAFPANTGATNVTYAVTLTSSNAGGSNTRVKTGMITVIPLKPMIDFSANKTTGAVPLAVRFTDTSTGGAGSSWQWNFGDGTANSTVQNPVHYYQVMGTYTVALTITNDGGSSTKQVSNMITANPPAPVAQFTSNVTFGKSQLAVQFTDMSSGTPTAWQWNFGDGSGNATVQNPVHYFPVNNGPGNVTYTVTLTSSNAGGGNTVVKTGYITVVPPKPIANFSADKTSGAAPFAARFTNTSTGGAGSSYQWSFGDGTSNSTMQNPIHRYNSAGNYTVTLTVFNDGGSDTKQVASMITVNPPTTPPVVWKTYISNNGGNTVSVIDQSSDTVTNTITTGSEPLGIAYSPGGDFIYVVQNKPALVNVISTANDSIVRTITVGKNPRGVAISPDGNRLYVSNYGDNSISVIDTSAMGNDKTLGNITGVLNPFGLCVSPDGGRLYVSTYRGSNVYVIDIANDANVIIKTLPADRAYFVSTNGDGSKLFVANYGSNSINVYETNNYTNITTMATASGPMSPIISPDGSRLYYVTDGDSKLTIAYAENYTTIKTVTCGKGVRGIACSPDGTKVYVTNMNSGSTSVVNVAGDNGTIIKTATVGRYPYGLGQFAGYITGN